MQPANLNFDAVNVSDGNDSIVIVNALAHIPGGRTLDIDAYSAATGGDVPPVFKAGHVIIKDTNTGHYLPLPVDDGEYISLEEEEGVEYAGVLKASVVSSDPRASIVTAGQVNAAASPYPVTDEIKGGLFRIEFLY